MKKALALSKRFSTPFKIVPSGQEGYIATCYGGKLEVEAGCPKCSAHALSTLLRMKEKGILPEFLGEKRPRFPYRAIWGEHLGNNLEKLSQNLLFSGFNTIVTKEEKQASLFREYGFFVCSAGLAHWSDLVLYQSTPTFSNGLTYSEKIAKELQETEQQLSSHQKLIFLIGIKPLNLEQLSMVAHSKTMIAFDATGPFWEQLRQIRHPLSTPLVPVVALSNPKLEEYRQRAERHPFGGFITRFDTPPEEMALWKVGQSLFFNKPSFLF